MPNYKYVCTRCNCTKFYDMSIGVDPRQTLCCEECSLGNMERRISLPEKFSGIIYTKLGDWYKNKTGKELMGES